MSKREDSKLRDTAIKVLIATSSCKELVGALVACDPTSHTSKAWTIVSLGLT
ncbi:hypothetical protein ETB97_009552 [Aspergillus alliaceus]|uniref:Uncharacterized protein n=1 Tax=Petromyces alliaceus TaxID=209559 RepID=A0A8H5ZR18_PETAA|nr:hypothetical protein ETB97_009552 [Aspergillus burnettii]